MDIFNCDSEYSCIKGGGWSFKRLFVWIYLLYIVWMNPAPKFGNYKLSFLERKKQVSAIPTTTPVLTQSPLHSYSQIGNQYRHAINLISRVIPFMFSLQPTNSIVILGEILPTQQLTITTTLQQYGPTILNTFYNTELEGSVTTTIFKFKNNSIASSAKNSIESLPSDLHVVYCQDYYHTNTLQELGDKRRRVFSGPQNPLLQRMIDILAQQVVVEGQCLEKQIRQLNHPHFQFLKYRSSPEYQYYRYKTLQQYLLSINQGRLENPVDLPLEIQENGYVCSSPSKYPYPHLLPQLKRQIFVSLIESVDFTKQRIAELMVFAVANSNHSAEIAYTLCQSPLSDSKQVLLRLYIISDILHNSQALTYPGIFQVLLPNFIYTNFKKFSISSDQEADIKKVLEVWSQKLSVYEKQFFKGLEYTITTLVEAPEKILEDNYWHPSILNKQQEQIQGECNRLGLPTIGPYPLFLSLFLQEDDLKRCGRVEKVFDGQELTDEDVKKIKRNQVDVMTFHPLHHLYSQRNI